MPSPPRLVADPPPTAPPRQSATAGKAATAAVVAAVVRGEGGKGGCEGEAVGEVRLPEKYRWKSHRKRWRLAGKIRQKSTVFREPPYPFDYPMRRLTMEEILAKFIDEGRREHEEMEIFIKEFRTTNELLLETRSNLLSELKIEVNELSKVVSNVLIQKNEVKGVTTRGGKMTSEATCSKEINETGINKNEPPRFEQDVQEKPHDDDVKNKSSSIPERTTKPLEKPQHSSIPFLDRVRKQKEEALQ
ncbi:hypothetical protein Tco_0375244 [Tanacetum coccineum]